VRGVDRCTAGGQAETGREAEAGGRRREIARERIQVAARAAAEEIEGSEPIKSPARAGLFVGFRARPGGNFPLTSVGCGRASLSDPSALLRSGRLLTGRRHELVEVLLGDAEPEDVLVPELLPRLVDLLELRIRLGEAVVDLLSGLVARLHDLPRKRPELDARGY